MKRPDLKRSDRFLNLALAAYDRGNWLSALQHLKQSIDTEPSFLPAYHELAELYVSLGRLDTAQQVVKRSLLITPDDFQSLLLMGNLLLAHGECKQALEIYHQLEKREAGELLVDLLLNIALAYHAKSDLKSAENYARRAIAADPGYPEAQELLGKILFEENEMTGAEASFRRILKTEPLHPTAHQMLAIICSKSLRWKEAVRGWETVIRIDPERDEAVRELGWALHMTGQDDRSETMLRRAIAMNQENLQARIDLGAVLMGQRRFDEALRELEMAKSADPSSPLLENLKSQVDDLRRSCPPQ